jgi:hypothetical protein
MKSQTLVHLMIALVVRPNIASFRIGFPIATLAAICLLHPSALSAVPKDFIPDATFTGSALSGWHTLGQAGWRAENGEIIGTPTQTNGGWLVLDKGYQDIQILASFRSTGDGKAGMLLRAEKTPDGGMKAIFVSLGGDNAAYNIVLDAQGNETSRANLLGPPSAPLSRMATTWQAKERVPGFAGLAPLPTASTTRAGGAGGRAGGAGRGRGGGAAPSADGWSTVQIILDCDILKVALVGGRGGSGGSTSDRMMGFGPIALYAGGSGEVRYKDVSYKDINPKYEPKEMVSTNFTMQRISDFYYGWCAAAADINHDGILDIVSGPFYYLGPDYTERHEFTAARTYNPSDEFCQGMVCFAYDFTGDGWSDILMVDQRPIYLYVNPRGESRRWDRYKVVDPAIGEIELLKDIEGDGKREVLFSGDQNTMSYAKPDPANPTAPWIITKISAPGGGSGHGMGVGDINGDGRMDIVGPRGWYEHPPKGVEQATWTFHPEAFGVGGAEMGIYDVNGDGLNDVVTAINAHGWGLAWFEQKRDQDKNISFVRHDIMGDFSTKNAGGVTFAELHACIYADIDGDGIPDIIVGKRLYSHLETHLDPDPNGPAVLYWYRTVRNPNAPGGAEFVPEIIHNRSGVGSHFEVVDLRHDGAMDIITSVNKGTFIFWGKPHPAR